MSNKISGRLLLLAGTALLILLFAWEVFSDELTVVEIRRNIPMSEHDPVYKDYYITAGPAQGIKRHMVVTAYRKVSLKDASGNSNVGEFDAPVGMLKVIFVGEKISVARNYKEISRDDEPMLEQTAVMIGDKIDLKGSFVDNHVTPAKTSAESSEVQTTVVQAPTVSDSANTAPTTAPAPAKSPQQAQTASADKAIVPKAEKDVVKPEASSGEKPEAESKATAKPTEKQNKVSATKGPTEDDDSASDIAPPKVIARHASSNSEAEESAAQ